METSGLFSYLQFKIGPLAITASIIASWFVSLFLINAAWLSTSKLSTTPGNYQIILESIFTAMEETVQAVLPQHVNLVFPFIATLWIFILISNLLGVIPGFSSPTSDLSVTASLAILTFLSVHWFGFRAEGLKNYLQHYLAPSPILLPVHLFSEISRTLALAVRLFGNMMSLELAALLVLMVAGFLVPVPILMLHIIEAVIQAYIFGMLALIYIAGGIQAQELKKLQDSNF
jgi:F-type H+-transporting ATPase subunit a